jgi:hypothetical protein
MGEIIMSPTLWNHGKYRKKPNRTPVVDEYLRRNHACNADESFGKTAPLLLQQYPEKKTPIPFVKKNHHLSKARTPVSPGIVV